MCLSRHHRRLSGHCGHLRRVGEAKDGVNAIKFLETIADPETSLEVQQGQGFCAGTDDVDVSSLPAYQRQASNRCGTTRYCCRSRTVNSCPPNSEAIYDAVATFVQSKNSDAFIDILQDSIGASPDDDVRRGARWKEDS